VGERPLGTDEAVAIQEFMNGDDGLPGNALFWVAFAPYDYGFRDHRRICRAPPAAVMFCDLVGSTALSATLASRTCEA
jgi:hypothetical protein